MGDGGYIKIWEHNWLLDPSNSRVDSPWNNTDAIYVKELFFCRQENMGSRSGGEYFSAMGS